MIRVDDKGIWVLGYFVSPVSINEKIFQTNVPIQEEEDTVQPELEF